MTNYLLLTALNLYDPEIYGSANLQGCLLDSQRAERIFSTLPGNTVKNKLTDKDATNAEVLAQLTWCAEQMKPGDRFIWHHSGHGTYRNFRRGKVQHRACARCLYNNVLWDGDLLPYWKQFPKGSQIILFSDTCFSESNFRAVSLVQGTGTAKSLTLPDAMRAQPLRTNGRLPAGVSVIHMAACTYTQVAYETPTDAGVFTAAMRDAYAVAGWDTWEQYFTTIVKNMKKGYPQTPVLEHNAAGRRLMRKKIS